MTEDQEHGSGLWRHGSGTLVYEDSMWLSRERRSSLEKQCLGTVRYTGWRGRRQGRDEQTGEEKSRRALLECFSGSFGVSQGTPGHRAGVRSTFLSEMV